MTTKALKHISIRATVIGLACCSTAAAQPAGQPAAQSAKDLWRAQARIDRGDLVAARPILDALFAGELQSPTDAFPDIAQALMNTALAQGDDATALRVWIALAAQGVDQPVTAIPPFWAGRVEAQAALELLEDAPDRPTLVRFRELAKRQAQPKRSPDPETVGPTDGSTDQPTAPGELPQDLLGITLAALDDDQETRVRARDRLAEQLGEAPTSPGDHWLSLALGRSLLMEPDQQDRILGIAHLLSVEAHAVAGTTPTPPSLRVLALVLAHNAARDDALDDTADAIRLELETTFATYPKLDERLQ